MVRQGFVRRIASGCLGAAVAVLMLSDAAPEFVPLAESRSRGIRKITASRRQFPVGVMPRYTDA